MPPRSKPLPNAINLFRCDRCNVGFSRQTEYDNHLNSYGHTHTKRFADLKQLTANEAENSRSKGSLEMRANDPGHTKKPVLGSGFASIGGPGSGFKKVGKVTKVASGGPERKNKPTEDGEKSAEHATKSKEIEKSTKVDVLDKQEYKNDDDVAMGGCEADETQVATWEEYDYTKPTGCDHVNCLGCRAADEDEHEYDKDGWFVFVYKD